MKSCPACHSQYTDDTLNFCLQDGTPLVDPTAARTVSFTEQETVVAAPRQTAPPFSDPVRPTAAFEQPAPKRSKFLIVAVVFLTVVLLAFVGIGIWILYVGGSPYSRTNPMLANANTEKPSASKPAQANRPAAVATPSSSPTADAAKVKSEVNDRIESWRRSLETLDLDGFMSNYAESIDYYNGRRTRASVRDDKSRAFVKFDSMSMRITNMNITPGPGDSRASAVFDKEWVFSNAGGDRNAGKVTQQMILERIDGKWLITLEKDLKVIVRPQ